MLQPLKNIILKIAEWAHLKVFGYPLTDGARKFIVNVGWMSGSSLIGMLFVTNIIAVRLLGPEEYGKYALILSLSQLFLIPMMMGITTAATKYIASEKEKGGIVTTTLVAIPIFTFLATLLLIAGRTSVSGFLKIDGVIFWTLLFFSVISTFKCSAESVLKGLRNFKCVAKLELANSAMLFFGFFGYIILTGDRSFQSYVIASCIGLIAYSLGAFLGMKGALGKFKLRELKKMLHYGSYGLFGGVAAFILGNISSILMNRELGFAALGLYAAYSSSAVFFSSKISAPLSSVIFPTASGYSDTGAVFAKVARALRFMFIPLFIVNFFVIAALFLVYGRRYGFNLGIAALFSLDAVVSLCVQMLVNLLMGRDIAGVGFATKVTVGMSILAFMMYYFFIPKFQLLGVIGTSLAVNVMFLVIYYGKLRKYVSPGEPKMV